MHVPEGSLDTSSQSKPYGLGNYVALSVYWFAFSVLWGGFLSVVLPALNKPLATPIFGEDHVETARGILSGLGLIIAMFVQPFSGAISDRSTHRWGRRRPFIVVGTLGGICALGLVGIAGNWWILLAGYLMLQFADNVAQGAYQGLMPDVVPDDKRGRASAALSISQLTGTLLGAVLPGILQGMLGEITGSQVTLVVVALDFILMTTITAIFVKEKPYVSKEKISPWQAGLSMFRGVSHYPDFILLMASRFLFLTAPASVSLFVKPFLENTGFIEPTLVNGKVEINAGATTSLTLGLVIIMAVLAAYPSAALSERLGRKKVIYIAIGFGIVGGLLLLVPYFVMSGAVTDVKNLAEAAKQARLNEIRPMANGLVIAFGAFIGASWGTFMAVDWAFATDLIPLSEAGRFMGLSNLATAGCQAVAAFIGGFVVDSALGYSGLFVLIAIYYLISAVILTRVRETRGRAAHALSQAELAG
ncbi:MAG: MFS transporter [Chloroflexota bacterium]|nr:MFS transporter [Chloroflexota bacterium]